MEQHNGAAPATMRVGQLLEAFHSLGVCSWAGAFGIWQVNKQTV